MWKQVEGILFIYVHIIGEIYYYIVVWVGSINNVLSAEN